MASVEPVDFRGVRRRASTVGGFTLTESVYGAEDSLPLHAHANPFFALLVSGSYTERLEQGQRQCAPSSLAFYPAGIPHADHFDGRGGRAFLVELEDDELACLDSDPGLDSGNLGEIRDSRLNVLALRLYAEFVKGTAMGETIAEEVGMEMVAELRALPGLGRESVPPGWLGRVVDRIHGEFCTAVRVGELAEEAGVHPIHLSRVFRRHHGCSIGRYVQRLRLQAACPAVVSTDEPLSSFAIRLGYSDQPHFTRRFGEMTGLSPGKLRRLARWPLEGRGADARESSIPPPPPTPTPTAQP